jgi:hypothetical protein
MQTDSESYHLCSFKTHIMDSLDSSFTIEINDKPIAKIGDDEDAQVFSQAQVNTDAKVAMFTLKDGRLRCGDWLLSCFIIEDLSLMPKWVVWVKDQNAAQPVKAEQKDDSRFA